LILIGFISKLSSRLKKNQSKKDARRSAQGAKRKTPANQAKAARGEK
jgi:hypothetical protein